MAFDTVISKYPREVQSAYSRVELAQTPEGMLVELSGLLRTLSTNKKTADGFQKLRGEVDDRTTELERAKRDLLEWIEDKTKLMRRQYCTRNSGVKSALDKLDLALSGRDPTINFKGYFSHICSLFLTAVRAITRYGWKEQPEDWLEWKTVCEHFVMKETVAGGASGGEIRPWSKKGLALALQIGHGFIGAKEIQDHSVIQEELAKRWEVRFGVVESILYPPVFDRGFPPQGSAFDWRVKTDCDAPFILGELLALTEEQGGVDGSINARTPKDALEADQHCNRQLRKFHQSFYIGKSWREGGLQRDDILSLVQRLLCSLPTITTEKAAPKRGSHKAKEKARKWVRVVIEEEYERLCRLGTPPKNYQPLHNAVCRNLVKAPEKIRQACSSTLIENTLTAWGADIGFVCKRGKAKK